MAYERGTVDMKCLKCGATTEFEVVFTKEPVVCSGCGDEREPRLRYDAEAILGFYVGFWDVWWILGYEKDPNG